MGCKVIGWGLRDQRFPSPQPFTLCPDYWLPPPLLTVQQEERRKGVFWGPFLDHHPSTWIGPGAPPVSVPAAVVLEPHSLDALSATRCVPLVPFCYWAVQRSPLSNYPPPPPPLVIPPLRWGGGVVPGYPKWGGMGLPPSPSPRYWQPFSAA